MAITADVSGRLPKVAQPPVAEIITIKEDMELQSALLDSGQARLEQMGYKQELDRKFDMFSSFSASFSLMSFMMGVTGERPSQAPFFLSVTHICCVIDSSINSHALHSHLQHTA